jgi:superfamily II DNA or RNA helicase
MEGRNWRALELAVARLVSHCGWHSVQDVGGSGDKGADILAVRTSAENKSESYLFQVKAVSGISYVGLPAIEQALIGQSHYRTKIVIVVTNGEYTDTVFSHVKRLRNDGFDIRLWNGAFLRQLLEQWPEYQPTRKDLRKYQNRIVQKIVDRFDDGLKKSFFIVATGLGKTVIASTATDLLMQKGLKKVLVLCHSVDLAHQLQKEFWTQISKSIPTRLFSGGEAPIPIEGLNFGLYQTLYGYLGGLDRDAFDLIIVDEAHHALANAFSTCMEHFRPNHLIGMTATPWRGDGALVESLFGEPIDRVSLVDGMRMGYLAKVDYRIMCDNIVWDEIPKLAKKSISVRDLNKRLFLPQRDDAVIKLILSAAKEFDSPRIAVFSPSVFHADAFAMRLTSSGLPSANVSIPDKAKRRKILMDFASGRLVSLTSVDVLNEGIDLPDLNILVFLRATHSRRIFVQQLGRGLRLADGKQKVVVLDFVTDIRRMAAVALFDREARDALTPGDVETVYLRDGIVSFNDTRVKTFVDAWLEDVTGLDEAEDAEKLTFPEGML